jgi:sec-independent protein translocase protein TatC
MTTLACPAQGMSFWEHLQELRTRLVRCVLAMAGAFALTYAFRFRLWTWAQLPFQEAMARKLRVAPAALQPWAFTDLTEPFFSLMRLSLWAAVAVAAPVLFYQVWAFIRPGLLPRERRLVVPFVLATSGMFLSGLAFAYTMGFRFLGDILFQEAAQARLRANLHIDAYLDLFLTTLGLTGLMFELPVLTFFLARFRLVSAGLMLRYWRHAVIAILVFSAFFTPGDVVLTTVFFSVVLLGLYFVSVLVAWAARPR